MGKPLISDTVLRGMYDTVRLLRIAKREPGFASTMPRAERAELLVEPEALLAALLSQVHRRDCVLTQHVNPLLSQALASKTFALAETSVHACQGNAEECAAVAAGMALRIASKVKVTEAPEHERPVVVALLHGFPPLTAVLQLIEQRQLSVLLIVSGDAESRAEAQRRLLSTRVPVMPVDRADAVALCRVLQECLLRARNGWGGAVIHAAPLAGSGDAMDLLRQHLEKRGLISAGA